MAAPIEFWFDFSSPYGYLAAQRIDKLAEISDIATDYTAQVNSGDENFCAK